MVCRSCGQDDVIVGVEGHAVHLCGVHLREGSRPCTKQMYRLQKSRSHVSSVSMTSTQAAHGPARRRWEQLLLFWQMHAAEASCRNCADLMA